MQDPPTRTLLDRGANAARRVHELLTTTGINALTLMRTARGAPAFLRDLREYSRSGGEEKFPIRFSSLRPMLGDRFGGAGTARGHYFHQDLWAARRIFEERPPAHLDIGSRIDGFVAHLLVFMPVTVVDVRDLQSEVTGLTFIKDDATELRSIRDASVASLSCLHAAEHFGLGRYGDPIDPAGPFKLMKALQRVLAPGGRLYFSVPVGRERLEFNAHRVFNPRTVTETLAGLTLKSFSVVDDSGSLAEDVPLEVGARQEYGCGLFEFAKAGAPLSPRG